MPIAGQSALTNITTAKELSIAYQPLLLAQIVWPDGTTLRLASENLSSTTGGNQYNGFDWEPRMSSQSIGAISSLSDNGIVQSPQIQLKLADADKFLWNEFEIVKGFKGAVLTLFFVFWDADTDTFSSDSRIKFIGICDAPSLDTQYLTLAAVNKINLSNFYLPLAQISQRCIWTFPVDKPGRVRAATAVNAPEFRCGYSPDVSDSDAAGGSAGARGNMNGGVPFTDCDFTWENCIARMGNAGLGTTTNDPNVRVQIEVDQSNRTTGTFGGIHYDPPDSWRGKAFTSGSLADGVNQTNQAKFNDYYPQTWGVSFIEPPVMNVVGDPNSTRFEIVLCIGDIFPDHHPNLPGPIMLVIVNDFSVPFVGSSSDALLAWSWVNFGGKFGHTNRGPIYDGQGDPYGSMAALQVVVPNIVAGSSSVPSVQVLTQGPAVRVWNSTDPTDFTTQFTSNFSWNLLDVLTNCGLQVSDLNLKTFIDGAATCAVQVTYTDLLGNSEQHDRYDIGITLRQRRTAADVLTNLLAAAKATLVPDDTGLLSLVIKQTLGDQQDAAVDGSNNTTSQDSADALGNDKSGFFAYVFNESNIARKPGPGRDQPTTFGIRQRTMRDTPNKVSVPFQDEDYSYAADSLTVVDSEDVGRTGVTVNGGVKVEGVVNIDQAKRVIETQLAEQFRGNPRTGINDTNDTGGTWIVDFETSFKAIHLKVGDLIGVDMPGWGLDLQPCRITGVTAQPNCERIAITAQWHEDDWYLDSYGQNPAPLLQAKHLNSLLRPPFGWLPNQEAPLDSDPLYAPTELNFAIAQIYQASSDSTVIASLQMTGHQPVNVFSGKSGPAYAPAATFLSGGNLQPGQYFFQICAEGSDGLPCAPSKPIASMTVPPMMTGSALIPNIYWMPGTIGYKVYGGTNPNKLSLQFDGSGAGTPTTITITDLIVAGEAMPDVEFDHLLYTYKRVGHSGVWQLPVETVASTVLTFTGLPFTPHEYIGRVVTILGQSDSQGNLPIWDFLIADNDNTDDLVGTFTLATVNGHTPDLVALGVKKGDMLIMRATPNIISTTTIGDTLYFNEIQYLNPILNINDASGSPIIIGTTTPHGLQTGDTVRVVAVQGNSAANGDWTATIPATMDASYNATHIQIPPNSNGTYEGYGVVQQSSFGLIPHAEKGNIVRIIGGTGRGQKRKIVENDTNTLTIDSPWDILPGLDTVFIIEDSGLLGSFPSSSVHNADPAAELVSSFTVDNYAGQVLLVQAYSCDAEGNQAVDSDSPYREIYVLGGDGTAVVQYDKATFNIATILDLAVADDVAPHYIVRRSGTPSSCRVSITVPPTGAPAIIDIILQKNDGSFTGSIFGTTKIVIPDGSTALLTMDSTFFADGIAFSEDDLLLINVTQVGSTQAGRVVAIVLKWAVS